MKKSQESSVDAIGQISVKSLESLRNVKLKYTVALKRLPKKITMPYKVKVVPNIHKGFSMNSDELICSTKDNIGQRSHPQGNAFNRQIKPVAIENALQHTIERNKMYKVIEIDGMMMLADLDEPSNNDVINIKENYSPNVMDTQMTEQDQNKPTSSKTSQNSVNRRKETPKQIQMPKGIAVNYNIFQQTAQTEENLSNGQIPGPVAVALPQGVTQEKKNSQPKLVEPLSNENNTDKNNSNRVNVTQITKQDKKLINKSGHSDLVNSPLKGNNAASMPTTEEIIESALNIGDLLESQESIPEEVTIISDDEDDAHEPNKKLKIFSTPTNLTHIKKGDPMVVVPRDKYTQIKSRLEVLLNKITNLEKTLLEKQTINKENMEEIEKVKKEKQAALDENLKLNEKNEKLQKELNVMTPMVQAFNNNFSKAQIYKIINGRSSSLPLWTDADLEKMVGLRQMISARAYDYIKYHLRMPVPNFAIIKKWMTKKNIPLTSLLSKKETAACCRGLCNTKKQNKSSKSNRANMKFETNADTKAASSQPADPRTAPPDAHDAPTVQAAEETTAAVNAIVTQTQLMHADTHAIEGDTDLINYGEQLLFYLEDVKADNYIIQYDESGQDVENIQENIVIHDKNIQDDYEVQLGNKVQEFHDNVMQQDNLEDHNDNMQNDTHVDGNKNSPGYPKLEQISTVLGDMLKTPLMQNLRNRQRGAPKFAANQLCQLCLQPFTSEEEVRQHVPVHYFNIFYTNYLHASNPYKCEFCGDAVKSRKLLIQHHRHHLGIKAFRCWEEDCQFIAKTPVSLWKHRRLHREPPLRCEQCPQAYHKAGQLRAHLLRCHGDRTRHRCQLCGALCRSSYSFWLHVRSHSKPPRFECSEEECGQKFYSMVSLRAHKRETHAVGIYTCPQCPLAIYRTEFHLQRHVQRHETQRFNRCSTCQKMFQDYTSFFHHLKTAHVSPEYKCICNEEFVSKLKYQRHMKTCELVVSDHEDDKKKKRSPRKIKPSDADSSSTKEVRKNAPKDADSLSAALPEPHQQESSKAVEGDGNKLTLKKVVNTYSKQKYVNVTIQSGQTINPEPGKSQEIDQNVESISQQIIPNTISVQTQSREEEKTSLNHEVKPTHKRSPEKVVPKKRKMNYVPVKNFKLFKNLVNTNDFLDRETALPGQNVQINVKIDEKSRDISIEVQGKGNSARTFAAASGVSQPDMPLIDAMVDLQALQDKPQTLQDEQQMYDVQDDPQAHQEKPLVCQDDHHCRQVDPQARPQEEQQAQHYGPWVNHQIQHVPQLSKLKEAPKPKVMAYPIPDSAKESVLLNVTRPQTMLLDNRLFRPVRQAPNTEWPKRHELLKVIKPKTLQNKQQIHNVQDDSHLLRLRIMAHQKKPLVCQDDHHSRQVDPQARPQEEQQAQHYGLRVIDLKQRAPQSSKLKEAPKPKVMAYPIPDSAKESVLLNVTRPQTMLLDNRLFRPVRQAPNTEWPKRHELLKVIKPKTLQNKQQIYNVQDDSHLLRLRIMAHQEKPLVCQDDHHSRQVDPQARPQEEQQAQHYGLRVIDLKQRVPQSSKDPHNHLMEAGGLEPMRKLKTLVADPNILGETKAHRFRWLGLVERMGKDRVVKRAYLGQPTGHRPLGRPRYRWKDVVEADLRELDASKWRKTAKDRQKWKDQTSEAKIHFESLSQRSK